MNKNEAVVLLSGGLDSATTAAIARRDGYEIHAMTFFYGQRHDIELEYAGKLADFFGVMDHVHIDIPSEIFRSALLKNSLIPVPRNRDQLDFKNIPDTYVPARNILFLSYALAYAESTGSGAIFIGANAIDYSGYPDCRPEFFDAFVRMSAVGTRTGVEGNPVIIKTPLIMMKKSEIIRTGLSLGVDYSLTHSCYDPFDDGTPCGWCDSCIIRKNGFAEAGVDDPAICGGSL